MTLKEFLKAWRECKSNDELLTKYGLNQTEFDEIKCELEELKWEENWQEVWYDEFYDYFLERLKKEDINAIQIKEIFRLDDLKVSKSKELAKNYGFVIALWELWGMQFDFK